jgi:hypothetical protein
MKAIIFSLLVYFLPGTGLIFCQSLGVSIGYGYLSMGEVNQDLKDTENLFSNAGAKTNEPDEVKGGLFIEGNFKYSIGKFNLGITADYVSSSGNFSYGDQSGSLHEDYDVSTTEVLGLIEIVFPIELSSWQPFVQLAAGVGFANAERTIDLRIYDPNAAYLNLLNKVDGNYFAGRVKAGADYIIQNVMLEAAVGYRLANAGELKGEQVENGTTYTDMYVNDINGSKVEFNYSGFFVTVGVSIRF